MLECIDVDECSLEIKFCDWNLHCTNTVGSYVCGCHNGYEQVMSKCVDVNECESQQSCPFNSKCKNTDGSFTCLCDDGYS